MNALDGQMIHTAVLVLQDAGRPSSSSLGDDEVMASGISVEDSFASGSWLRLKKDLGCCVTFTSWRRNLHVSPHELLDAAPRPGHGSIYPGLEIGTCTLHVACTMCNTPH